MIAVPTDGGGVTVTGSLQCPYYLHAALKTGLGLDDRAARVVQAETGGGFGGKEEFPSVIGLHAALLARKAQQAGPDDLRPPRGHRGHDQAPPGHRPAPDRRHARRRARRAGHRGRDGRRRVLHAHAGRPVARRAPRRRPVPLPERADPGQGHPDQHAAQRRVPRVRRAADRVRGRDPPQPDRRGARDLAARHPPAQRLPARRHDPDRPGAARERRRRGGPGARGRGRRVRAAAGTDRDARRGRAGSGIGPRVGAADGTRPDRHRASAWRSRGTAPASPARARSSSPASPRSS